MKQLHVYYDDQHVGTIQPLETGQMQFAYTETWLDSDDAFPISLSMPLTTPLIEPKIAHNFFANLLPEASVRQRICAKLKISPGNDFGLLDAIGGDCAGALTITASDVTPTRGANYHTISNELLETWSIGAPDAFSDVTGQNGVRLSLAGAQDKLPVCADGDTLLLPQGDSPSTHLLKFASPFYSHLPENETLTTMLAAAVGLPVVKIALQQTDAAAIAIIERYDRRKDGQLWKRLHQEDICQVLGISSLHKYEKEGGPSLRQCCELIKRHCSVPALEIDKLVRWAIFNLLAGNSDAHGKNLSILFTHGGGITLAPFYDLVCTRNYENLDRHLAMSIGSEFDPGQIGRAHLRGLAADLEVRESLVIESVVQMANAIPEQLPSVVTRFRANYGESPVLERLPIKINEQVRRTMTLLDE